MDGCDGASATTVPTPAPWTPAPWTPAPWTPGHGGGGGGE